MTGADTRPPDGACAPPADGIPASPLGAQDPDILLKQHLPARWGPFEVIRLLGEGGMGRVYQAFDTRLKRPVALKILRTEDSDQVERFLREAQLQAQVTHDHVCRVYEVGRQDGHHFIAMQLIEGLALRDAFPEMPLEQKVLVIRDAALGLHAAHGLGLTHRDVKPGNIMLERSGTGGWKAYVVDFGIARSITPTGLTISGNLLGSPLYMSPEQARGDNQRIDRRSDVYSLGASFYEILTGRAVFEGASPINVLVKVLGEDPRPLRKIDPSLPADLEKIVMRCLEKEPQQRYESARHLAEDLDRFLAGDPVLARPVGPVYRMRKWAQKHRALVATAAVALIVAGVLGVMWLQERRVAARQVELAQRFGQKVERVESLLWRNVSLESHDIRPAKVLAVQRLADIEREMVRIGPVAHGPGHSALGRGWLMLNDLDRAQRHLETAWQSGFRTPEVAYASGLALGRLYQRELAALARIRDPEERENRRRQIEQSLRDPALAYLRACGGVDLATPEYVQALIAFLEKRYPEALVQARRAFDRVPWLYEAKILEGDVLSSMGREQSTAGRYAAAREQYLEAEAAYRTAGGIGRSDIRVYQGLGLLWRNILIMEVWMQGAGDPLTMRNAAAACRQALVVDADTPAVHNLLAEIHLTWANHLSVTAQDPTGDLQAAMAAAATAVRLEPDNDAFWRTRGLAAWVLGKYKIGVDEDARATLLEAAEHERRAVKLNPRNVFALSDLALIYLNLGLNESQWGRDAVSSYQEAVAFSRKVQRIDPNLLENLATLGLAYGNWASDRNAQRLNGLDQAVEGIAVLRQAVAINSQHPLSLFALGRCLTEAARAEFIAGADPAGHLGEAERQLAEAERLTPNDPNIHEARMLFHLLQAEIAVQSGRSPRPEFALAHQALKRMKALTPGAWKQDLQEAHLLLREAGAEAALGRSPLPLLSAAEHSLGRIRKVGRNAAGWLLTLDARDHEMEWLLRRGQDPRTVLQQAQRMLAVLAKMDARADDKLFWTIHLDVWAARLCRQEPARRGLVRQAREAIARHPGLSLRLAADQAWLDQQRP